MNNYAKRKTWNNIWYQKDRIKQWWQWYQRLRFFFFINLSHLCIRRFIHFSYASIYLCIVYTLLLLVVHWRHSPQLQTILHRFNFPSFSQSSYSFISPRKQRNHHSIVFIHQRHSSLSTLDYDCAVYDCRANNRGEVYRNVPTIVQYPREEKETRPKTLENVVFFHPYRRVFLPSLFPSFYSFSLSGLTNSSRFVLFVSKESFVLSFLFGRNHVIKDCTKWRQMARWPSRKIRANASLQRMKKRLPNASWTLVSRFSIRSSDHAHANVVHLYNDYICWLELNF